MKYELEKLDEIISVSLDPRNLSEQKNTLAYLTRCQRSVYAETLMLRKQFTLEVFKTPDESVNTIYIQQHQRAITKLADKLFEYQQLYNESKPIKGKSAKQNADPYENIYRCLEELLNYIEQHYPKYFGRNLELPVMHQRKVAVEMQVMLKDLKKSLQRINVTDELINIICQPFDEQVRRTAKLTYAELNCLKELQQGILQAVENNVPDISKTLLSLNFNTLAFYDFLREHLANTGKQIPDLNEQIEYYSLQMKEINQLPEKTRLRINPASLPIREQISYWISEELDYLKLRQVTMQTSLSKEEEKTETEKIETSLSVAKLSMAFKLLMDAGIIINNNSKEVMRIVARTFRTVNTPNISEGSLWNKSYNFETATVESMKATVVQMMNLMKEYGKGE